LVFDERLDHYPFMILACFICVYALQFMNSIIAIGIIVARRYQSK